MDLKNRAVLVIGGGSVALRKIEMLRRTGAIVQIVSRTLCIELINMLSMPGISWVSKNFNPVMLDTVFLVIIATDDFNLNNLIYQNAEKRHVLVNTVDDRSKCSCIFPSIVDRAPVVIGISSSGTAPVLTRILREEIELLLPESLGLLAKLAGIWRNRVKKNIVNAICRRRFWEKIFYDSHVAMLIEQGNVKEASRVMECTININNSCNKKKGSVVLVGAGPGDKGLLTIRGLHMLQRADVILYDYLVSASVLELARRDVNKICVGKSAGKNSICQKEINSLIIQLAQQGKRVVRLKGGDPFIFGRGGEELQAIFEAGISFQVVPGITSGIGVAAYAGIPLTHRHYAHSVTFITGHCSNNSELNWNILSDSQQTLVIYMGMLNVIKISKNLILHGRDMYTPVALISRGTYKDQQVFIGNLAELENLINMTRNPTLLIIGNVVSLHNELHWFGYNKQ